MALTQSYKPTILISSALSSSQSCFTSSLTLPVKTHATNAHFFVTIPSRIQSLQNPSPTFCRRLFLPSVSAIWDALTGGNNAGEAVRRGMILFKQGDVLGSLAEFDIALELDPRQKAYLWQRGLSLYYLDRYQFFE
uniref:Uncharacterized protein n=1 Tax=Rhizophora mucronata TaxID=61149 RepID=A0A2P2J0Y5_RHIMU